MSKKLVVSMILALGACVAVRIPAFAKVETVTICKGALEPTVIAACVSAFVLAHEAVADRPFSNKGEGAKAGTKIRNKVGQITGLQKPVKNLGKALGIKL